MHRTYFQRPCKRKPDIRPHARNVSDSGGHYIRYQRYRYGPLYDSRADHVKYADLHAEKDHTGLGENAGIYRSRCVFRNDRGLPAGRICAEPV